MRFIKYLFLFTITAVLVLSCSTGSNTSSNRNPNEVVVWELSDAQMLNPINYTDAGAGYILKNIYLGMLSIDFNTLELVPVLAESRPQIDVRSDGKMLITYNIRKEAVWDDGTPVTAKDVEFSLKVIKNPKVNNERLRPYYEFIEDIMFYDEDLYKYTFVCKDVYILAEASSGDIPVLQKSFHDPDGLMNEFTIPQLNAEQKELAENPKIIQFAEWYNSEKFQREPQYIKGCGAYKLKEWVTGQRIVLEKKNNWWGDKYKKENSYFNANAPIIVYQTINDQTTAIVALKAGNIDVARAIPATEFIKLPESEKYTQNFTSHTPVQLEYNYIGVNTKRDLLSDKNVRKALAHLTDVDKMIKVIQYGLAERVVGPIHPTKKLHYNNTLKPYDFNIEQAKRLLAAAGWLDNNGNGTVDKKIGGKDVELEIDYMYNAGNDERKSVGLMLQEAARKAGIKINVVAKEWSVFLDNLKHHNFDLYMGGWIQTPVANDHKQIYHTESYNGGSNYTGFGNDESDAIIDSIRVALDDNKQAELNKKLQEILYDECSYIYLYSRNNKVAIHKRFSNAEPSVMRPGYWEAGFSVSGQVTQ